MEPSPGVTLKKGAKKLNILLVDDQQAKLLSYEVILAGIGETLIKASSACEAFECLLRNDFALILIDVCMPDIDGFELAALIREHPRFQRIAIIFVSAVMTADLHQLRGYELGAVDYIAVPVVPELLRAKVKMFVDLFHKTRQLERLNAELERWQRSFLANPLRRDLIHRHTIEAPLVEEVRGGIGDGLSRGEAPAGPAVGNQARCGTWWRTSCSSMTSTGPTARSNEAIDSAGCGC